MLLSQSPEKSVIQYVISNLTMIIYCARIEMAVEKILKVIYFNLRRVLRAGLKASMVGWGNP